MSLLLFQAIFTFLLLLAIIITCVLPFVNNKTGEIDNLSELRWEQSYLCLCAGPRQSRRLHLLIISGVLWETNLGILTEGNSLLNCITPSTWGSPTKGGKPLSSGHGRGGA